MTRSQRLFKNTINAFDLYVYSSAIVSVFLFCLLSLELTSFPEAFFFPTLFIVGHYSFLTYTAHVRRFFKHRSPEVMAFPSLFLFQILTLIAMSYHLEIFDILYFALIPCLAAGLYFMIPGHRANRRPGAKLSQLTLIGLMSIALLQSLKTGPETLIQREGLFLVIFGVWSALLFYGVQNFLSFGKNQDKRVRHEHSDFDLEEAPRDQYFYHDMINLTHGVVLFLKQQQKKGESLGVQDQGLIISEIESLQSLMKSHFGYTHKNLKDQSEIKSFDQTKPALYSLITHYLLAQGINTHLIFEGLIDDSLELEKRSSCEVHFPTLYRVMNNLIKNSYEHKVQEVEILFNYTVEGLFISLKNPLRPNMTKEKPLESSLSEVILGNVHELKTSQKDKEGLGLESVSSLVQAQGGEFSCKIEDGHWVSKVFLPRPQKQSQTPEKLAS